jgi:ABC-type transport system substrate-binding protein
MSSRVLSGKVDATGFLPDFGPLNKRFGSNSAAAKGGHQRVFIYPVPAIIYLALNTKRPLFGRASTRRALSYAVDRTEVASALGGSPFYEPFDHYLPPAFPGYREMRLYPRRGSLRAAQHLVAGHTGQAVFYHPQEAFLSPFVAVIKKALRDLGIRVDDKAFPWSVAIAKAQDRGTPFDIAFAYWWPDYPDPRDVLNVLASGSEIRDHVNTNGAYFDNRSVDRDIAAAAMRKGRARLDAYSRIDSDLARHESPYVVLTTYKTAFFFSARMGCQVYSPVPKYEIDYAALCLRK